MNTLIHQPCGAKVDRQPASDEAGNKAPLFADSLTQDAVTHCPGCGKPLAQIPREEFGLYRPTGQPIGAVKAPRAKPSVRHGAQKALRQAVREMKARQAARAQA